MGRVGKALYALVFTVFAGLFGILSFFGISGSNDKLDGGAPRLDMYDLTAQEVVDRLDLGMDENDLRRLMTTDPVVDEEVNQPYLASGGIRRQLYFLSTRRIAVVALLDHAERVQLISVTSLDEALHLTFPNEVTGNYAGFFATTRTNLRELRASCFDVFGGGGMGASWGYFAVACGPAGVNGFGTNIVAINLFGPGNTQPGFSTDLILQLESGQSAPEVDELTFNTFSWADYEYLFGGMDRNASARFADFVDLFSLGPGRGEPVSSAYSWAAN